MYVKYLLKGLDYKVLQGTDHINVSNIAWDSRKVKRNSLFICVKGKNVDRHDYALQAVEAGATTLVVEHQVKPLPTDINVIQVNNTKMAMAKIADIYYENPSDYMNVIGITGTNGKTSVSWFVAKILETAGRNAGIIGTIENRAGKNQIKIEKVNPTTPDSIELQATLREMLESGVTDVAMEVTSIALENHRVDQCKFNIGVFTNLTQDHLDEHGTMENYKNAKLKLFKMCRYGIVNSDDEVFSEIKNQSTCEKILSYGINNDADLKAKDIQYTINGVRFTLLFNDSNYKVNINIPGKFTVYNALAAIGVCYYSGLTMEQIIKGLGKIEGVRGRFEAVPNPKGCLIIVDYAHTPDGLANILESVKDIAKRNVITVFGCGGDRDRSKRPVMGEIAGKLSDECIITSDNPRTEDPALIINDIQVGICKTKCSYEKIENRRSAIYRALDIAQPEDVVVIAGKGHETYQIFGDNIIHFDDSEVVKEYFSII
jgi:UDP-N-acetylmuramoyl-L-alanyl-D-glutamate--2,6-diaminopimelate ligase